MTAEMTTHLDVAPETLGLLQALSPCDVRAALADFVAADWKVSSENIVGLRTEPENLAACPSQRQRRLSSADRISVFYSVIVDLDDFSEETIAKVKEATISARTGTITLQSPSGISAPALADLEFDLEPMILPPSADGNETETAVNETDMAVNEANLDSGAETLDSAVTTDSLLPGTVLSRLEGTWLEDYDQFILGGGAVLVFFVCGLSCYKCCRRRKAVEKRPLKRGTEYPESEKPDLEEGAAPGLPVAEIWEMKDLDTGGVVWGRISRGALTFPPCFAETVYAESELESKSESIWPSAPSPQSSASSSPQSRRPWFSSPRSSDASPWSRGGVSPATRLSVLD